MVPDNHALLLFRFSEHRWINAIIEGTLSFSCAGNFVEQAMKTDNNIQGDMKAFLQDWESWIQR